VITIPVFDYRCNKCDTITEVIQVHNTEDEIFQCECGGVFKKTVPTTPPSFELRYNNKTDICDWAGNTTRYYDDYKAAKARGEDVKPLGED